MSVDVSGGRGRAGRWRVSWKWVVLWSLWAARATRHPTPELRVRGGLLRGEIAHDGSHAAYLAIPYATLGPEHRFKAPGPEPQWEGLFDAVNENVRCQQELVAGVTVGRERCLTLNVYTPLPLATSQHPLPVMVFIHGGGFFSGSGSRFLYSPKYLVTKGVILVTFNYRLNIQGFLCLRTKDAPGNAGMKDQVAALRWVQRNIAAFGGDPSNVTIFGESAGGASVSYHILSPMSAGLFHRAILQSGSALSAWAYQYRPVYMASLLAKTMGYHTENEKELYDVFTSKSDYELIATRVPRKDGNIILTELLYVPCTEAEVEGEEAFLTDLPFKLLSEGKFNKVPIIIGANNEEGYFFASLENSTTIPKIDIAKSLPKDLVIPTVVERKEAAKYLRQLYLGRENITEENIVQWSRFHGEVYINLPVLTETELILQWSEQPVYSYQFEYSGWRNLVKMTAGKRLSAAPGASHADELFYLFASFGSILSYFEDEMIETMTTLWTNFAKYGQPETPTRVWGAVRRDNPQMLRLAAPAPLPATTLPFWHSASLRYWRDLYRKYRRLEYYHFFSLTSLSA